jgi:F0F1-type ATP synthase assembly protein I
MNSRPPSNKQFFLRFAGLGAQLLASLGLAVFLGLKADGWLKTLPLFSITLPLLTLIAIFYKITRDTAKKNNDEK